MHLSDDPVTTIHQALVISLPRFLRIVDSKCWLDKCILCHTLIETVTAAHRQVRGGTDGRSRELCLQSGTDATLLLRLVGSNPQISINCFLLPPRRVCRF